MNWKLRFKKTVCQLMKEYWPLPPNIYVLEYSPSQGCFHIETLNEMLNGNLSNLFRNNNADYIAISISTDREKLYCLSDQLKQLRDENLERRNCKMGGEYEQ